jgi:undecaprenyl-diphosphatase
MEQFWAIVSLIGEPELWIFMPLALVLLYIVIRKAWPNSRARKPLKAFLFIIIPSITVVLGGIYLTKFMLPVDRPCIACTGPDDPLGCNPYCEGDASFPSGHAGASFTAFTALYVLGRKKRHLLLFLVPVLVGISRLTLGVHAPADVLVGASLGILVTSIVWSRERYRNWF